MNSGIRSCGTLKKKSLLATTMLTLWWAAHIAENGITPIFKNEIENINPEGFIYFQG
jgi:hypothetical protein